MIESVLLAGFGCAAGLALARLGIDVLVKVLAGGSALPRAHEISIDDYVLGFTVGLSALTGLIFGGLR